jgi:gluconolactonase
VQDQIVIEKLSGEFFFVDGLAWSRTGFLVAADVLRKTLYRFDSGPRPRILRENDGGASGVAYDVQGRLYICESDTRRISRMDRQGAVDPFIETFEGKKFNAPNDIVVRRDGHIWFTDPAFGSADDHRELDFHGIFHASPKGEVDAVAKWKTRPNGIALSPDGRLLYVADSDRHAVAVFDVDRNGAAANQRDFVRGIDGVPGGLKTDEKGRLFVCARGITVFSTAGKQEMKFMEDRIVVNCSFGDADGGTLYVSVRSEIYKTSVGVKGAFQY